MRRHLGDHPVQPRQVGDQPADELGGVARHQARRAAKSDHCQQDGQGQGPALVQAGEMLAQHPREAVDDHHQEQSQGDRGENGVQSVKRPAGGHHGHQDQGNAHS